MNYEKLHKDTIAKLQEMVNSGKITVKTACGICADFVPESENEKIRKDLIAYCQINMGHSWHNIWKEDYIAWLKKQGEPIDINPSEFDLRLNKLLKQFETLPKEELTNSLSFYLNVVQNDGTYREEKQGKQKPVVIIPKFRVGDEIKTANEEPLTITEITDSGYWSEDLFICCFDDAAKWELVEQKPAELGQPEVTKTSDQEAKPNGGIVYEDFNDGDGYYKVNLAYLSKPQVELIENLVTSWQTPILDKSGYTFDFEKKELKKNENELSTFEEELFSAFSDGWQKYLNEQGLDITEWVKEHSALLLKAAKQELKKIENEIEIPFGAKDSELQEATYYIPKDFHAEIDDDKVVIKRGEKPTAWSEENERRLNNIIRRIIASGDSSIFGLVKGDVDWLKSIKDRYTWKPTEEQLYYLSWIANIKLGDSVVEQEVSKHLNELYEQLKQL